MPSDWSQYEETQTAPVGKWEQYAEAPTPDYAATRPGVPKPNIPVEYGGPTGAAIMAHGNRPPSPPATPEEARMRGMMIGGMAAAPVAGLAGAIGGAGVMGLGTLLGGLSGQAASTGNLGTPRAAAKDALTGAGSELGARVATAAAPYVLPVGKGLVKGYIRKAIPEEARAAYKTVQATRAAQATAPTAATIPQAEAATNTVQVSPKTYLKKIGADDPSSVIKTAQDQAAVDALRAKIRAGEPVEPVSIVHDSAGNVVGADGRHRALAAHLEGVERIPVNMQRAGEAGTPIPVGTLPKETPNPPYASKSAPQMEMVDSTNVYKVGHNGKAMWIEYRNGRVYDYAGVPQEIFQKAKEAESIGSFISRNIKGRYATTYRGSTLGKK